MIKHFFTILNDFFTFPVKDPEPSVSGRGRRPERGDSLRGRVKTPGTAAASGPSRRLARPARGQSTISPPKVVTIEKPFPVSVIKVQISGQSPPMLDTGCDDGHFPCGDGRFFRDDDHFFFHIGQIFFYDERNC